MQKHLKLNADGVFLLCNIFPFSQFFLTPCSLPFRCSCQQEVGGICGWPKHAQAGQLWLSASNRAPASVPGFLWLLRQGKVLLEGDPGNNAVSKDEADERVMTSEPWVHRLQQARVCALKKSQSCLSMVSRQPDHFDLWPLTLTRLFLHTTVTLWILFSFFNFF